MSLPDQRKNESGLPADAVGLAGLISESLGCTSSEQSEVLFGGTVAVFVGAGAPCGYARVSSETPAELDTRGPGDA